MKKILTASLLFISLSVYAASSFTTHFLLELPQDGDAGWGDAYRSAMTTIDTQMYTNQQSIVDHIADALGAHAATAISTTSGSLVCTSAINVQTYLDCLDDQVGAITGGAVVTINTDQTITGQKTFSQAILADGGVEGDLIGNVTGDVTGDLTGNVTGDVTGNLTGNVTGDVSGSAATFTGNLTGDVTSVGMATTIAAGVIVDADINASAAITRSKLATGTAHALIVNDTSGVLSSLGPLTNGQLLIGSTGAAAVAAAITGTTNQVNVTNGAGSITLATPQNIHTGASPTFTGLTLSGLSDGFVTSTTGVLGSQTDIVLTTDVTGVLPLANGGTNKNMTAVNGGVVWTDADSQEVTAAGSSGQVLTSAGAAAPTWQAPSAGAATYNAYSSDQTLSGTPEQFVVCSGAGTDITLYACTASESGYKVSVKRNDASNACTILRGSTNTIDALTSFILSFDLQAITMVCNGAGAWFIF